MIAIPRGRLEILGPADGKRFGAWSMPRIILTRSVLDNASVLERPFKGGTSVSIRMRRIEAIQIRKFYLSE
jgi:hypothetical protein